MSVHKMNPDVKAKWVAALRSGDYEQGTGWLRKQFAVNGKVKDQFCCLGVLCNLHAQEHPEIAAKENNPREYLSCRLELPAAVVQWAGLNSHDPYIGNGEAACVNISYVNDHTKWGFSKIADEIEKQF